MFLAQRAAEHREILGEDENGASVHGAPAGDHAVPGDLGLLHAEIRAAMLDEHVVFLERAVIHQELDPLARGQFALGVLRRDPRLAAPQARAGAAAIETGEHVFHGRLRVAIHPSRAKAARSKPSPVMAGPSRSIHVLDRQSSSRRSRAVAASSRSHRQLDDVDGRDQPGHDRGWCFADGGSMGAVAPETGRASDVRSSVPNGSSKFKIEVRRQAPFSSR